MTPEQIKELEKLSFEIGKPEINQDETLNVEFYTKCYELVTKFNKEKCKDA